MFDVAIVGGGPAGLSAALVLGRCRRRVLLCDDGKPRNQASRAVHNFLTREGMAPDDLLRIARLQLRPYAIDFRKVTVTRGRTCERGFQLSLSDGRRVRVSKILLATGIRDLAPDIPGVARFIGRGVYYCAYCDGYTVRDRPLAALGSGVGGADLALGLTTWSDDVLYVSTGRRRPVGPICARLEHYNVAVRHERIIAVEGTRHLKAIIFAGGGRVRCEGLFVQHGCVPQSDLARQLGCAFTRRGAVATSKGCRTSVDSVFVAGDAADRPHAVVVAAASGAEAAFCINQELRELERNLKRTHPRS